MISTREIRSPTVKAFCGYHGTKDPVAAIKQLVRRVASLAGEHTPPYEPTVMLPFCPVPVDPQIRRVRMAADASIKPVDGQFQVFLNANQSDVRNRFSLAHELTHTFFLPFRESPRETNDGLDYQHCDDPEEERLCNIGAAEVLMPEFDVHNKLAGKLPTTALVKELAKRYEVSHRAMAVQTCKLSEHPLLIGALLSDFVSFNRRLRLMWYAASGRAAVRRNAALLCRETRLPEGNPCA